MIIENILYFIMGLLVAGLVAMMVIPAIWRRAVRVTRKRIEAATPMTLSEFKADKDQLRAEFAMSTRRLEMNVDALRKRLSGQLNEINAKRIEVQTIKTEHQDREKQVSELLSREVMLKKRITELEREGAAVARKLRKSEEELSQSIHAELSTKTREDIAKKLNETLDAERKRSSFLQEQVERLGKQLDEQQKSEEKQLLKLDKLKAQLESREKDLVDTEDALSIAEKNMATSEKQLNAILEQTNTALDRREDHAHELAKTNSELEHELQDLRQKLKSFQTLIENDWETERVEHSFLRERLNDLASDVSKLVYALHGEPIAKEVSPHDKILKYAGESDDPITLETSIPENTKASAETVATPKNVSKKGKKRTNGDVSTRLRALKEHRTQDGSAN